MFTQGPIPPSLHAIADYVAGVALIVAPFVLGFDDVGAATALAIVAGIAVIVLAASTCWSLSLIEVVPTRLHASLDLVMGALFVAAPFLFTFSEDSGAATALFIALGVLTILGTIATRWVDRVAAHR